jgi:hypothetical protein
VSNVTAAPRLTATVGLHGSPPDLGVQRSARADGGPRSAPTGPLTGSYAAAVAAAGSPVAAAAWHDSLDHALIAILQVSA